MNIAWSFCSGFAPVTETQLMSPRTVRYVQAMVQEGDNFDYCTWLRGPREEQDQAKQFLAASAARNFTHSFVRAQRS